MFPVQNRRMHVGFRLVCCDLCGRSSPLRGSRRIQLQGRSGARQRPRIDGKDVAQGMGESSLSGLVMLRHVGVPGGDGRVAGLRFEGSRGRIGSSRRRVAQIVLARDFGADVGVLERYGLLQASHDLPHVRPASALRLHTGPRHLRHLPHRFRVELAFQVRVHDGVDVAAPLSALCLHKSDSGHVQIENWCAEVETCDG